MAALSVGRPNPGAAPWAELFFAHEVACHLRPGGATPGMAAARIPADLARATVGYAEA